MHVVVTGASSGIGEAVAREYLRRPDAKVTLIARRRDRLDKLAEGNESRTHVVQADLGNPEVAFSWLDAAEEALGPIDVLVNNAGTIRRNAAAEYSLADWDVVMRTNLDATFMLCQHFGREMVSRGGGKIINIASLLSFSGGITVPAYTASKHAVAGLTKAFANEWGQHNVQVNAIAPGYFRTDNTLALQADEIRSEQISARIPAGRWGEPSDLAGAVVFLASRASDYVNGHVLVVDGGWMAR